MNNNNTQLIHKNQMENIFYTKSMILNMQLLLFIYLFFNWMAVSTNPQQRSGEPDKSSAQMLWPASAPPNANMMYPNHQGKGTGYFE